MATPDSPTATGPANLLVLPVSIDQAVARPAPNKHSALHALEDLLLLRVELVLREHAGVEQPF
jgi:hypothetical protein